MGIISRGFLGRRRDSKRQPPPGQYLTNDFRSYRQDQHPAYRWTPGNSQSRLSWATATAGAGRSSWHCLPTRSQ